MTDWNKEFPITSITRADLKQAGFTDAQIQTLEDADLQEIAAMMADIYLDNGYWEDLQLCVNRFFKADEEDSCNCGDSVCLCPIKLPEGEKA